MIIFKIILFIILFVCFIWTIVEVDKAITKLNPTSKEHAWIAMLIVGISGLSIFLGLVLISFFI